MYLVTTTAVITVGGLHRDSMEKLFHMMGEAFMARQGQGSPLLDHAVSLDRGASTIEFELTVAATSQDEGDDLTDRYIRAVLAETGGQPSQKQAARDAFGLPFPTKRPYKVLDRELVSA